MDLMIRQERTLEYDLTEDVIQKSFLNEEYSDKQEHNLVKRIRESDAFVPELSLVAVNPENTIVGHILLSKIKIKNSNKEVTSLALAPVSVLPDYQRKNIGSQLVRAVLKKANEFGFDSIIVLGHKDFYSKFGFKQASLFGIQAPFDVPDEVFMATELTDNALEGVRGVVQYSKAFEG